MPSTKWQYSRAQLVIRPGENYASQAFTIETGPMRDLVLYDGPDAVGGISVSLSGFAMNGDYSEQYPVLNWALYAGNVCLFDDEPIFTGSTFLSPGNLERQGLLFDVRGRDATSWLLRGYCTLKSSKYEMRASATVSPLPPGTSPLTRVAGTVIG